MYLYADTLNSSDLRNVVEELHNIRAKWQDLGLALGFHLPGDLDAIDQDSKSVQEKLRLLLQKWLSTGEASWEVLITALRTKTVHEDGLAKELASKYCPGLNPTTVRCKYI